MHHVIAIVGMSGAGKSVVAEYFQKKGYVSIHFGDITFEEMEKRGLPLNEENEKLVREVLRKEQGMDAYAVLNLPKIEKTVKDSDVIIDGLYSWAEYKFLKKALPSLQILAVVSSPDLRYQRLENRPVRPLTRQEAVTRDYSEIEHIEKGGPIAMADYTVVNDGTLEEIKQALDMIFITIGRGISNYESRVPNKKS